MGLSSLQFNNLSSNCSFHLRRREKKQIRITRNREEICLRHVLESLFLARARTAKKDLHALLICQSTFVLFISMKNLKVIYWEDFQRITANDDNNNNNKHISCTPQRTKKRNGKTLCHHWVDWFPNFFFCRFSTNNVIVVLRHLL